MLSQDEMWELRDSGLSNDTYWDKQHAREVAALGYDPAALAGGPTDEQLEYLSGVLDAHLDDFAELVKARSQHIASDPVRQLTEEADLTLKKVYSIVEMIRQMRLDELKSQFAIHQCPPDHPEYPSRWVLLRDGEIWAAPFHSKSEAEEQLDLELWPERDYDRED